MSADKDKIAELAYRIWQEEGQPHGRDLDHWIAAEAQLTTVQAADASVTVPATQEISKPARSTRSRPAAKPRTKASATVDKAEKKPARAPRKAKAAPAST